MMPQSSWQSRKETKYRECELSKRVVHTVFFVVIVAFLCAI